MIEDLAVSEYIETGMKSVEYGSYDVKSDLRLYIDAAGNVWNELTDGIL